MTVPAPSLLPLLSIELRYEHDVVLARQRARHIAELVGFDGQDQTRIATAVSELARNAHEYAGGGRVRFGVESARDGVQRLVVQVSDDGPGIRDLQAILDGRYVSPTGMGLGILGARRLMERFRIDSRLGAGTTVEVARPLPPSAVRVGADDATRIADTLSQRAPQSSFEEVQQQNQELLRALEEVRLRQAQVERLNAELEATNRGVLALYAELDDRAHDLKQASEHKSRFLSDVSHELRTPLTAVLNLARVLLDRGDGDLSPEQERQVLMIRQAVEGVTELVNDLLDIAKIEAGHTVLHDSAFTVVELFAALRGISRPLVSGDGVILAFEDTTGNAQLETDDKRLAQILRNFLSNAIKFTESGEIRVVASGVEGDKVCFAVSDTGIGISAADQVRIFEDYVQLDGPMQRRVRGTGLGLPLTRKLATLLGGRVELQSTLGVGSTFSVTIPRRRTGDTAAEATEPGNGEQALSWSGTTTGGGS